MICLCWNARGVGNPRAFRSLSRSIRCHKPHIVFISESLCSASIINRINCTFLDYFCFCIPSIGRSGGLLLLWNKEINLEVLSYSSGHIDSLIRDKAFIWRFTGFYGNPSTSQRTHTLGRYLTAFIYLCPSLGL